MDVYVGSRRGRHSPPCPDHAGEPPAAIFRPVHCDRLRRHTIILWRDQPRSGGVYAATTLLFGYLWRRGRRRYKPSRSHFRHIRLRDNFTKTEPDAFPAVNGNTLIPKRNSEISVNPSQGLDTATEGML